LRSPAITNEASRQRGHRAADRRPDRRFFPDK
jgi:hypothetical protein